MDLKAQMAAYLRGMEAVEAERFRELAEMTDERARQIIAMLACAEKPWREREDWSGLVEQQAIFQRWWKR